MSSAGWSGCSPRWPSTAWSAAYLEWIASLPWDKSTEDNLDLENAREVLDHDHYDIEQVKDRILEFLAVRKLKPDARGSILLFVGPPGVGKTSLGRSMARALGRKFERISVGGVRDEAEIRGHRRTYIGAMPGVIIRALRDAGANNPLLMIDEIDKMGADFRGDPSSAMLEVLDPEQNHAFRDHYLDLPFDLSNVMFVTTANTLETIPGPLRDRMEVIQLAGYTADEKLEIAKRYLVPRQIERNGLSRAAGRLHRLGAARDHRRLHARGRGAPARARDRRVVRKVARQVAEGKLNRKVTSPSRECASCSAGAASSPRPAAGPRGPVWPPGWPGRPVGGEVLFIEATAMPGRGNLTITGQLGEVMRESAQAALSYVRANAPSCCPSSAATGSPSTTSTSTSRRARSRRMVQRRGGDGDRAGVAAVRTARALRRGDDRRGHADRPGAADRRTEGEGAGRPAQRDQDA